jgi:trehalose/maltose hydrolase-like predicted phosphorylase
VVTRADPWRFTWEGFDSETEGAREALCTLGNGYLATRGALPEFTADGVHYPGTYAAGCYNALTGEVADRRVTNESMVNLPNWLPLSIRIDDGPWLGTVCATDGDPAPDPQPAVLHHEVALDLTRAILTRTTVLADPDGRRVRLTQRRLVSMADLHTAALETTVAIEGWSGTLGVRTAVDGRVRNGNVRRYAALPNEHWSDVTCRHVDDEVACLSAVTRTSRVRVGVATRTRVSVEPTSLDRPRPPTPIGAAGTADWLGHEYRLDVADGSEVRIDKVAWLFTSRDAGYGEPAAEACRWATSVEDRFDDLAARHVVAWRHLWERVRIDLGTDGKVAAHLHLHQYHLLTTLPPASAELVDAGVPARGLHGEAYRGHVFWDELFVLPTLDLRLPEVARSALTYRYRRLPAARHAAASAGLEGALFPWQSGANGTEQTQSLHLNPASGRWLPDATRLQRHVNAAIAHNVWHHYEATGDVAFLAGMGGELLLEVARLFASLATYDHAGDRWRIRGVVGPDEFHDAYPPEWGAERGTGVDDNAYTNLMASWCLTQAARALDELPSAAARELRERVGLTGAELDRWEVIGRRLRVPFLTDDDGSPVLAQFDGYERLGELDWDDYRRRYGDVGRLDRILEAEGDTPNRYRVAKQADALMAYFVLGTDDVTRVLQRLGYDVDDDLLGRTLDYYRPRTAHGSTLSRVVHAWVCAHADREGSWRLFREALATDTAGVKGGTTAEGIHLGAMAGTVDLLQRCYSGLAPRHGALHLDPRLPTELAPLSFDVHYRGHLVRLRLDAGGTVVRIEPGGRADPTQPDVVRIAHHGPAGVTVHEVAAGHTLELPAEETSVVGDRPAAMTSLPPGGLSDAARRSGVR